MTIKQRRNRVIPKLIGRFKMLTAKRINKFRRTSGGPFWQRNYFEQVQKYFVAGRKKHP